MKSESVSSKYAVYEQTRFAFVLGDLIEFYLSESGSVDFFRVLCEEGVAGISEQSLMIIGMSSPLHILELHAQYSVELTKRYVEHYGVTKDQVLNPSSFSNHGCRILYFAAENNLEMLRYCMETWKISNQDIVD